MIMILFHDYVYMNCINHLCWVYTVIEDCSLHSYPVFLTGIKVEKKRFPYIHPAFLVKVTVAYCAANKIFLSAADKVIF